jgi:hypothetical protein
MTPSTIRKPLFLLYRELGCLEAYMSTGGKLFLQDDQQVGEKGWYEMESRGSGKMVNLHHQSQPHALELIAKYSNASYVRRGLAA